MKLPDMPLGIRHNFLKYADATIIIQIERKRLVLKTKTFTEEIAFYVGSSGLLDLTEKEIYQIQREHWLIESRGNYVRDVFMQDDNYFTKSHKASHCLGAIRDLVLNIAFLNRDGKIKNYFTHLSSKFLELLYPVRSLEIYHILSNHGVCQT